MEAEESELPSVSNKSWSAMNVLNGKAERAQSWEMKPDESGGAALARASSLPSRNASHSSSVMSCFGPCTASFKAAFLQRDDRGRNALHKVSGLCPCFFGLGKLL